MASKEHDIPLHENIPNTKRITQEQRIEYQLHNLKYRLKELSKPIQFLDMDTYDFKYRSIRAFHFIHSHDVVPEYDYFSTYVHSCRKLLESLQRNQDITFNKYMRASVASKRAKSYINRYSENEQQIVEYYPAEEGLFIDISIPSKLAKRFYEGTEVPNNPKYALVNSILDIPKVVLAMPFALMMGLGAPDVSEQDKELSRMGFPAPWPEDVPTHFKLDKESIEK